MIKVLFTVLRCPVPNKFRYFIQTLCATCIYASKRKLLSHFRVPSLAYSTIEEITHVYFHFQKITVAPAVEEL